MNGEWVGVAEPGLTSQVRLSLPTAGLLRPIVTAKKPFRFLYSLQLQQNTQELRQAQQRGTRKAAAV